MTETAETGELFLTFSRERLQLLASRITDCLSRLSNEQIWQRGSDVENSVANLVLHLCGNVRQWIVSGVGGQPDIRDRDTEFASRDVIATAELRALLDGTISAALLALDHVSPGTLPRRIAVQGKHPSVLEAIYTVLEHFGEHTGQIIYITKQLTHTDLGYHAHLSKRAATKSP